MCIHMSVCIGFPNHIQPGANIHFNTLLFSTHKAFVTLRGVYNKHCLLTLLVRKEGADCFAFRWFLACVLSVLVCLLFLLLSLVGCVL